MIDSGSAATAMPVRTTDSDVRFSARSNCTSLIKSKRRWLAP